MEQWQVSVLTCEIVIGILIAFWQAVSLFFELLAPCTALPEEMPNGNEYDDLFVAIAMAISRAQTLSEYSKAAKAVSTFEKRYSNTPVGQQDSRQLFDLLEQQERKILN